jgi:hypothetical protein
MNYYEQKSEITKRLFGANQFIFPHPNFKQYIAEIDALDARFGVPEDQDYEEPEELDSDSDSDSDDWYTRGCDLYHARKDDGYYED